MFPSTLYGSTRTSPGEQGPEPSHISLIFIRCLPGGFCNAQSFPVSLRIIPAVPAYRYIVTAHIIVPSFQACATVKISNHAAGVRIMPMAILIPCLISGPSADHAMPREAYRNQPPLPIVIYQLELGCDFEVDLGCHVVPLFCSHLQSHHITTARIMSTPFFFQLCC